MVIIVVEAMELVMLIGAMSFIVTVMVVMEVMVVMMVIAVDQAERDVCCVYPYPTFNHVTMWRFRNNLRLAGRRINLCRSRPSRKHFTR